MSKTVTLRPSQKQLFASWENELRNIQQQIGSIFNELVLFRLEKIAAELGIDTDKEKWTFDFQQKAFVSVEEKTEAKPTIPGRKRGRPKTGITDQYLAKKVKQGLPTTASDVEEEAIDAEVIDEDEEGLEPTESD